MYQINVSERMQENTEQTSRKSEQISSILQLCSKSSALRKDWLKLAGIIPCHICLNTPALHLDVFLVLLKDFKIHSGCDHHQTCTWNCRAWHSFSTWCVEWVFVTVTRRIPQLKHWAPLLTSIYNLLWNHLSTSGLTTAGFTFLLATLAFYHCVPG